ncbi:hypothetical protein OG21DRAFT_1470336 [Imleria badia]|nr:hypothetical protein OG21DRAFT_1470336 [Imleria badia]
MVQTRSAAKRIESGKVHNDNGTLQENPTVDLASGNGVPSPAKKRRREEAAPSKKRRRGKPSELCQLNLDVLFLIAAYIHPIDLLNLARTCKSLRDLLMDRSSEFVWKTARQQVKGLPACPADLTEPEYANLVFYARCHGCGKYTTTILWNVRRRFCPGCRIRRLRRLSSCNEIIRKNSVLAVEYITAKKESTTRVDRDQAASFMDDYRQSSDKKQFISDKQKQCRFILQHAKKCEAWQKKRESERKDEQKRRQLERGQRIFQRLNQHGYSRELNYFGYSSIQRCRDSDFRTSKPLTDREWERMRPEWAKVMDKFRSRRLEAVVYEPRRRSLVSAYNRYVTHPSPEAPTFDLLPHVADLARLPAFRDIINAPEETQVDDKSFTSAFAQLPMLVAEWRKKLDAELAELMEIPLHLSSENASKALTPSSTTQSLNADLDRLHLACALFQTAHPGVFTHVEVFSVSMLNRRYDNDREDDSEHRGSISAGFGVQFLKEAPYIVHACGLDPSVATVDDMDHRNARLKCLFCGGRSFVWNWRHAMWHASSCHQTSTLAPLSTSPRWQLVGDEHIDAIQTVEQSIERNLFPSSTRCLLCRPHIGDVMTKRQISSHLYESHDITIECIKQGVHYAPIGICDSQLVVVEMVEEGKQVTFKVPLS